jgi:FtsZ-binding cell division protein ZapB
MDTLQARIQEAIDKDLAFDLEVLLDEVKESTKAQSEQHKEDLHQLGQSFQRSYDERINALRTIINTEVNSIKQNPTTPIEDLQGLYKRLKKASEILATFTTVFN